MDAALPRETAAELAHRVAMVRDSVPMDELGDVVEALGECRRYGTEHWFLDAVGLRTVARDLVRTEPQRGICQTCPVRDRCLALAILTRETDDSIHGGLLPAQQRRVAAALPGERVAPVRLLPSRVASEDRPPLQRDNEAQNVA